MKVFNLNYHENSNLSDFIIEHDIQDSSMLLIQIYTSSIENAFIERLVSQLNALLPHAVIIGCTTDGEIVNGNVMENGTVISFISFEKTTVRSSLLNRKSYTSSFQLGETMAQQLLAENTKVFIIFLDAHLTQAEQFINGVYNVAPHVILAGGLSSNKHNQTVLFSKEGFVSEGAVGISLSGPDLIAYNQYSLNWKPIGKYFEVTHMDGNRLYSIDGMNVIDLYRKYLGEKIAKQIIVKSSQFPFILNRNGMNTSVAVHAVNDDGSVTVAGNLNIGDKVRFGYGDPDLIVDGSKKMIELLMDRSIEVILVYSCDSRRRFMFNSIGYEVSPLQKIAPTAGFFTHGEFYHQMQNMLLNHTMTLLTLSENPDAIRMHDFDNKDEQANNWEMVDALKAMSNLTQVSSDELVQLNALLTMSEQRYKSLVQYNPEIVYSIDANGDFLSLNSAFYQMLGYRDDHPVSLFNLIDPKDSDMIRRAMEHAFQGNSQTFEVSLLNETNSMIPFVITKIPIVVNEEIVGVYGIAKNILESKQAEHQISYMALHDVLTELPNRTLLYKNLSDLLNADPYKKKKFAVMFIDLDNFKEINDTYGHLAGDQMLKRFAFELRQILKDNGMIARFGGDEFAIILHVDEDLCDVEELVQQIVLYFEDPLYLKGVELLITISLGVSVYPNDGDNPEALLRNADLAMYKAKQSGKNGYHFYTDKLRDETNNKRRMVKEMRKAIQQNQLQVYYQPMVDLKTGQLIGAEALARWFHPELGTVPPSLFIPLAEEYGLIDELGNWVLQTACIQNKRWRDEYGEALLIAINVSYQQFQRIDFVEVVQKVLNDTGMSPELLNLEITESTALVNLEHTQSILDELQKFGISISMDDFGTGYSSLSCVKDLSINKLKIDRSFITNIAANERDAAIVKTIVNLARDLNIKVLAEGVEWEDQLEKLREYKCDEIQGYLFSPPLPVDQFEGLLVKWKSKNIMIDATIVHVHQHGDGAKGGSNFRKLAD